MVAAILALFCAVVYGAADFLGGLAARRTALVRVGLVAQVTGALLLLPVAGAGVPPWMGFADVAWVLAAGLGFLLGYAGLYGALAAGTMSVVAPVTAIVAIVAPVMAAVLFGESPGMFGVAGVVAAIFAVGLISREEPRPGRAQAADPAFRTLLVAIGAGTALGVAFVAFDRVSPETGLWPVVLARLVASLGFLMILLRGGLGVRLAGRWHAAGGLALAAGAGILDTIANVLFLLAARDGALAIVAPLASLYPASTILLARVFLAERVGRLQAIGLALALAAAVLLALA